VAAQTIHLAITVQVEGDRGNACDVGNRIWNAAKEDWVRLILSAEPTSSTSPSWR
jgi:hypothetical protein